MIMLLCSIMINGLPVQQKAELLQKDVVVCKGQSCETNFRVKFSKDDVQLINQNLCLYQDNN